MGFLWQKEKKWIGAAP